MLDGAPGCRPDLLLGRPRLADGADTGGTRVCGATVEQVTVEQQKLYDVATDAPSAAPAQSAQVGTTIWRLSNRAPLPFNRSGN